MILQWPMVLLLLVPVLGGGLLSQRWRPGPGGPARALVLTALILAGSGPTIQRSTDSRTVVFVLDTSGSIPPDEQERARAVIRQKREALSADDAVGLVTFSEAPSILALPGRAWPDRIPHDGGARTDLAAAVSRALSLIPPQTRGELVLLTDGHSQTDAQAVLSGADVAVTVIPLTPDAGPPGVTGITLETPSPAPGSTLSGSLTLHGGTSGLDGEIALSIGGESLPGVPASVAPGQQITLPFSIPLPPDLPEGPTTLAASAGQQRTEQALTVRAPAAVWIISGSPEAGAHLAALLSADGLPPTRIDPAAIPAVLDADLIVLADVSGEVLPADLDGALARYVREGGSLLTLGGEQAYDLGGWHRRPLAELLPIQMDPDGALKDDAVTLVIALDKSGSMAQSATRSRSEAELIGNVGDRLVGGRPAGSKIRLAAEGAVSALERLRDTDRIGVLTVDTRSRWAVSVQDVAQRAAITRQIRSISSGGGGIYTLTALEAARDGLRGSDTPLRHLILFADTSDAGEQERAGLTALGLVTELARDGITLSVIGIGTRSAQDAAFLEELARRGGGRFHATDDPEELPALFAQETEELLGAALEETRVRVQVARWHPALQGVAIEQAPALAGFNRVLPRPQARTVLTTDGESPLLSTWRVGLGEVVSVTTDDGGRWASSWRSWEGGSRLWIQLVRSLLDDTDLSTTLAISSSGQLTLSRYGPDGLSLPRPLLFASQGSAPQRLPLIPRAPGQWTADLPQGTVGPWQLEVVSESGDRLAVQHWAAPPGLEHTPRAPNTDLLTALSAEGSTAPPRADRAIPLWPWLVLLAMLLLPADALARRHVIR